MTEVLLMQVPSGKMRMGSLSGSSTCSFNLKNELIIKVICIELGGKKAHGDSKYLLATVSRSLTSDLSNQMWADARAKAR